MNKNTIDGFEWVNATRLTHGRPSHTYTQGRICAVPGCLTHLSRYNPTICCSIHNELH